MKFSTLLALALTVGIAGTACSDDNTTAPTPAPSTANVRVMHASPDAPNVDVLVDNVVVLTNVPFEAVSGYLSVPAGSHNVKVNATGTSTTVIDADVSLTAGTNYTVMATGLLASIEPLVLTDDLANPAAGNAKVRLVHAAPSAPTVDIYVTAPGADISMLAPTLSDVPFRGYSDYLEVPAGDYQVRVAVAGTKTVALDSGTLSLAAGEIRTGVALDAAGGGTPFGASVLADKN
jgi:hypothetical protein